MKTMQEIRMQQGNYMRIKAPKGYNDDRVMSLMMACYPFLTDEGRFGSTLVDYKAAMEDMKSKEKNGREDITWERWQNAGTGFNQ